MSIPDSVLKAVRKSLVDVDGAIDAAIEMMAEFGPSEARAVLTIATLPDPSRGRALSQALAQRAKTDKRIVKIGKDIKARATCDQPEALLNEADDLATAIRIAEAAGQSAEQLKRRAETVERQLLNRVPNPRELQMATSFVVVSALADRRFGPFDTIEGAAEWAKTHLPERQPKIESIFDPNRKMAIPVEPEAALPCELCGEIHDHRAQQVSQEG